MSRLHKFRLFLQEKNYRPSTIEGKLKDVAVFRTWLAEEKKSAQRLTYTEALKYVSVLKKRNLQPQTINFYLASIRSYYAFLKTKRNPFQTIEIRGTRHKLLTNTFTKAELLAIYNSYQANTPLRLRNKIITGLFCFQGITRTELHALSLSALFLQRGEICVPKTARSNERIMPLHPVQLMDLVDYLTVRSQLAEEHSTNNLIVFSGRNLDNAIAVIAGNIRKSIPKFQDFRQARNSVILNWLKENNLRKTQYLAGHRYISSTESYLVNDVDQLKENVLKFHPLNVK